MQNKNTICSHCQPWDETNLLSIYSSKAIETVESHKDLEILIGDLLYSAPCRKCGAGFEVLFSRTAQRFLLRLKLGKLQPLLIDYSDVLHPSLTSLHLHFSSWSFSLLQFSGKWFSMKPFWALEDRLQHIFIFCLYYKEILIQFCLFTPHCCIMMLLLHAQYQCQ